MQSDLEPTSLGMAALVACIVQALGERDRSFRQDFDHYLERAYRLVADKDEKASLVLFAVKDVLKNLQN